MIDEAPQSDSLLLRRNIDAACDLLETDWQAGRARDLESYLEPVELSDRPAYFREFLLLRLSLDPPEDWWAAQLEYSSRFPQWLSVIDQVLQNECPSVKRPPIEVALNAVKHATRIIRGKSSQAEAPKYTDDLQPFRLTPEASRLWAGVLRFLGGSGNHQARPTGQATLEVAESLVKAFPQRRQRILTSLFAGLPVSAIVADQATTERTIAKTIQCSLVLLADALKDARNY